jgi:glucose/arabinose dehydrogenase
LWVLLGVGRAAGETVPIDLPPGFSSQVFASALGSPRALAVDPAGTLVVAIPSQGRVVALPAGGSGAARVVTLLEALELPHGLAFRGGDLFVAETGRILRFRYDPHGLTARDPTVVVGGLPSGGHHWTRSIAFGPDGGLYVAVGSSCDVCREADPRRASIIRYEADGSGEWPYATGLRNPVGVAFHPRTGLLWATVNERDWRNGGAPPDYVTAVARGARLGWPDCYAERGRFAPDPELRDGRGCSGFTKPTLELPPHSAPLGLAFYSGTAFPVDYRDSLFVALHGARAGLPPSGYKVIRIALREGQPPAVEDFAVGWRNPNGVWGRPVDLAVGRDGALYISDDHGGRIVRIAFGHPRADFPTASDDPRARRRDPSN